MNTTCGTVTNTDITGIGVRALLSFIVVCVSGLLQNRVSLYAATVIGYVMTLLRPEDVEGFVDAARTSLVTSAALVVAGIASRYTSVGMSLVDGQVVTMLVFTIVTYCYSAGEELRDDPRLGMTYRTASLLHGILSCVFGIIVYANVNTFSSNGSGNPYTERCDLNEGAVFVVFGHSISAQNAGLRIFALVIFAFGLFEIIRKNRGGWILWILRLCMGIKREPLAGRQAKGVTSTGLALMIYMIVTTEQIIQRNGLQAQANQWTLGQTLSMLMVLDQLMKAISRIRKKGVDRARWQIYEDQLKMLGIHLDR